MFWFTEIGDGGMTLSGGQKARIALARAVYQDKSIYLLDDVLSAVDVKVARHIFQQCIMKMLKDKTRILCTHLIDYLAYADRVILMEKGAVKLQGELIVDVHLFDSLFLGIFIRCFLIQIEFIRCFTETSAYRDVARY